MSFADDPVLKGQALPRPPAMQRFFGSTAVSVIIYFIVVGVIVWGSFTGAQNMGYNWQWYRVPQYLYSFTDDGFQLGELLIGLGATIQLSLTAFVLACLIGLLVALLRLSDLLLGRAVAVAFLELIRNIPLLVLLYLFYYVLGPIFGLDRYTASILTLAVFHSALISEILRAGINAVCDRTMGGGKINRDEPNPDLSLYHPAPIRAFHVAADDGRSRASDQVFGHRQRDRGGRTDHPGPEHYIRHLHEL